MALARGLVEALVEQSSEHGFVRVRVVRLTLGALGHVDPEALRFCFDVVTRETLADGAALEIDQPAGTAHCLACDNDVVIQSRADLCPRCQSAQLMVTGGEDMRIKELEVE